MLNADQKYTKETRGPKSINKKKFICFWWGFLYAFLKNFCMHSWRKSLSEICITSLYNQCHFWHKRGNLTNLNFLNFHPILMHIFCKVCIFMSYWWTIIFFLLFYFKRGLKGSQCPVRLLDYADPFHKSSPSFSLYRSFSVVQYIF